MALLHFSLLVVDIGESLHSLKAFRASLTSWLHELFHQGRPGSELTFDDDLRIRKFLLLDAMISWIKIGKAVSGTVVERKNAFLRLEASSVFQIPHFFSLKIQAGALLVVGDGVALKSVIIVEMVATHVEAERN